MFAPVHVHDQIHIAKTLQDTLDTRHGRPFRAVKFPMPVESGLLQALVERLSNRRTLARRACIHNPENP